MCSGEAGDGGGVRDRNSREARGSGKRAISVIIPTLNALPTLRTCLESVLRAAGRHGMVEIIVVDNGSTDGSFEVLTSNYSTRARIVRLESVTIAKMRNYGASLARGEVLSFLDSDCAIPESYFLKAEAVFEKLGCAATGSMCGVPASPHWVEETWYGLHGRNRDGYVTYINSGNLLVRKQAFDQVGGFDDELVTGEDAALAQKLRGEGLKVYECRELSAVHFGNPKTIGEFFRRQLWHGLGALGTFRHHWWDKPVLLTMLHGALIILGIANLVLVREPWPVRLLVLLACFGFAPLLAVLYRSGQARKLYRPFRGILLYFLYLTARATSLLVILKRRLLGEKMQEMSWKRRRG